MSQRDVKDDIHKILVLRFSSLGDIVMATPLLRCLRLAYPKAQIDMVVREDFYDLIAHSPYLDQKIALSRGAGLKGLRALRRRLSREGYDLIYDAHQSLRTRFLMPLLPARYKAYYQKHYVRRSLALTLKLPLLKDERMLNRYIDPLVPYGVAWDGKGPEIFIPDGTLEAIPKLILPEGKLVGLVPSAQWEGKRWPASKFREVLQHLVESTEYGVVVFGGKSDHFCSEIAQGFPSDRVVNTQGQLSILQASALLARCEFAIANDTGLMHLADAVGTPCVLVLGPTSREMGCLPFHPESEIVERSLWCRPCSKNGQAPCIRKKRWCLELVGAEEVFERALKLGALHGERA
ncbi:MAG: glycosyltransferase family 9 protein [Bdellovibrionales bacterium]|nr:glycosyltransferase family 9 protein [Bdellovibrionales bacterium]